MNNQHLHAALGDSAHILVMEDPLNAVSRSAYPVLGAKQTIN